MHELEVGLNQTNLLPFGAFQKVFVTHSFYK